MGTFDPAKHLHHILASLVEVSDDAIVVTDLDAIILTWSRGASRLYGYAADEMVGQSMALLLLEEQKKLVPEYYARLRAGQRVEHFETRRVTKQGRVVEVSAVLTPVNDEDGAVVGALSVTRDIRGQKRSDAALQASEGRWRAVVESAVDGIVMIDARGRIEAFNPAAERLFGYAEREVVGKNVSMLMPSPHHEEHDGYLARYLREGQPRIIGVGREVTGRRRDGSTFPVHLAVGEMSLDGERKFTGILHDLSSRVRMEEQMREQAALAHLGEMAAVIAHEVKNPLAGIRGAIQVIGGRLPPDGPEAGITKEIVARIDTLSDLMKDLLLFSRPPQPNLALVDIPQLVAATAELLMADPAFGGVKVDVVGSVPRISADAGLLKIAFVNLLVNGAHAMKGQGTIRVTLSLEGDACVMAFNDTGPGISPDVLEKVFTPFFTTKSRGSGLGLPTARRIVEAHKGHIGIECPPLGGTTISIRLPAVH